MSWQPMETAPKRGERLILWVPKTNCGICVGRWEHRLVTHDLYIDGWWLEGFTLPFNKEPYLPTLWQPLPSPPSDGMQSDENGKVFIINDGKIVGKQG